MSVKSFKTSGVGVDLAPQGLVLINTTSFSGVTSVSFGSDAAPIFTSDYDNYQIIISNCVSATSAVGLSFRLRANVTDLTSSVYYYQESQIANTALTAGRTSGTSTRLSVLDAVNVNSCVAIITSPFLAKVKTIDSSGVLINSGPTVTNFNYKSLINSAVSYNGFTILSTQNISGTMSVYGLAK